MRLVLEKIISNGLYKYLLFDNFQIEKVNTLDIEKIKSYYNQIRSGIYVIVVETISLESD